MDKQPSKTLRWITFCLVLAGTGALFLWMVADHTPRRDLVKVDAYQAWPRDVVDLAGTLPVQEGGRVKPLSTQAGFMMLRLHGARSMRVLAVRDGVEEKLKLGPTEWLLDCLFRPRLAIHLPTFRVDNSDVLAAAGIGTGERRDRYSYAQIEAGRDRLIELAQGFEQIPEQNRDPVQRQTIDLAYNVQTFEWMIGYLGFARSGIEMLAVEGREDAPKRAEMSSVMATAPVIRQVLEQAGDPEKTPAHVRHLLDQVVSLSNLARVGLAMFPPDGGASGAWLNAGQRVMSVMTGSAESPDAAVADIKSLEELVRAEGRGMEDFGKAMRELHDRMKSRAGGDYRSVEIEAGYYRIDWFLRGLSSFAVAILLVAGMWLAAGTRAGRWLGWGVWAATSAGVFLTAGGIASRCVIMARPPVGNLYDTIPFITVSAVVVALVVEAFTRRGFVVGMAPVLGVLGLVLARRFELGDARDHMDPLVAVLDSNFWLVVHVITITLGYSAGLLSAALSHGYLLARGLGLDGGDRGLQRSLTRAVYGCLCFTLFLSLVGTVLGGIWANYSWGRFWGWDPKENGALMIVLWNLAILHARLGGLLNDWGLHLASVAGASIVVFSWWHVNFLGVGLHNYGFTAGKATIWAFYTLELLVLAGGVVAWAAKSRGKEAARVGEARLSC